MDNITLDELVRKYLSHCKFEKNLDAKTIKAYRIVNSAHTATLARTFSHSVTGY